jgi:hypothetical protein
VRDEETEFGVRVYYGPDDVSGVIDEAREMFWKPFAGWKARLRVSPSPAGLRYSLDFWVRGRWVFDGRDDDVTRLLGAFQVFLDECRDQVDRSKFVRRIHTAQLRVGAAVDAEAGTPP